MPEAPVHLVLAECSLELVPREIRAHPSVAASAQRTGRDAARTLLDSSLHHRAMRGLADAPRRGRPDIAHFCALLALGSRVSRAGRLRLYLHTRDDLVVFVKPETRLPRVYERFKGLFEQVLIEGAVPKDERLLAVETGGLGALLEELAPPRTILFTPAGARTKLAKVFPAAAKPDGVAVLIGGFPHGDFSKATAARATEKVSIADEPMEAWSITGEVLARLAHVEKLA